MRKILRNMAKAKMAQMGYSKINWREIIGAYPVNLFTGKKMPKKQIWQITLFLEKRLAVFMWELTRQNLAIVWQI